MASRVTSAADLYGAPLAATVPYLEDLTRRSRPALLKALDRQPLTAAERALVDEENLVIVWWRSLDIQQRFTLAALRMEARAERR